MHENPKECPTSVHDGLAGRAAWTHVDAAWAGWRPRDTETFDKVLQQLPAGAASTTTIAGQRWFRNVAANPNANIDLLIVEIQKAL